MSTLSLVAYENGITGSSDVDKPIFKPLYSAIEGFMLAEKKHDSQDSTYGLGTTSYYGHVKLYNNTNRSSYTNGEALSSYQGKVLNDKIDTKADEQSPQLKWNIGPNSTIPVTLREGGSDDKRALYLVVNDNVTEIINYDGVVFNNLIPSMYTYHFNDDGTTNKFINITFNCSNGFVCGFLFGYHDNYFITINLNEIDESGLNYDWVHFSRLYNGDYPYPGTPRTLLTAACIKTETDSKNYRLKLQYSEAVSILDILFISGNVKIYSVSSAAS